MKKMLVNVFALMASELGVSPSTINLILAISTLTVIALPLLFVVLSKKDVTKVTL